MIYIATEHSVSPYICKHLRMQVQSRVLICILHGHLDNDEWATWTDGQTDRRYVGTVVLCKYTLQCK